MSAAVAAGAAPSFLPRLPASEPLAQGQSIYKAQSHAAQKAKNLESTIQLSNFGPEPMEKSPLRPQVDERLLRDFFDSIDMFDKVVRMHVTNKNKRSTVFVSFPNTEIAMEAIEKHRASRARQVGRFFRIKATRVPATFGESFIFCI